jgi:hypothetical protein
LPFHAKLNPRTALIQVPGSITAWLETQWVTAKTGCALVAQLRANDAKNANQSHPISFMDEVTILKVLKLKSLNQLASNQPTKEGTTI